MRFRGIVTSLILLALGLLLAGCTLDFELSNTTTVQEPESTITLPKGSYEWPDTPDGLMGYESFTGGQREFYKDLYTRCDEFFEGGDISRDLTVMMEDFDGDYYGLTTDEMAAVWTVFTTENPRFYWLAHTMTVAGLSTVELLIVQEYQDAEVRSEMNQKLFDYLDGCAALLEGASNDLEKALIIHDYIINNMEYAYDDEGNAESAEWAHSIVGAMDRGEGVCEAYCKAFQLLCSVNGVTSIPVIGEATSGDSTFGHAWNYMNINGIWYGVDATWDDNADSEQHLYFGLDEATMALKHTPSNSEGTSVNYYFDVPECSDTRIAMVYLSSDSGSTVLYENPDAALAAMTDPNANYTVTLYPYAIGYIQTGDIKIYDSTDLFHVTAESTPEVESILFTAKLVRSGFKYYKHTLNFDNSCNLNCDLAFENMEVIAKSFTGTSMYALTRKNWKYTKITYA